ncbi:MAG TPA: phosphoglycerate kinase, partial [Phycisphaerae bacterium]|nr:phosphoglycerate kinase [Phycisphaerae bacterium]
MAKKTIAQVDVKGKKVLIRVDFNVPQDDNGNITDDRRIRMALPTIRHVLENGGSCILMSHLGRPEGKDRNADKKWTIRPCAERLSQLLGRPVKFVPDVIGPEVKAAAAALKPGDVLMLENVRFYA